MPMNRMRRVATALVASATVLAGTVATAPSAAAITRANCSARGDYLNIHSNQTTCWANAGGVSVMLYRVSGYSSGNNAGYLITSSGQKITFGKFQTGTFRSLTNVTYIRIY